MIKKLTSSRSWQTDLATLILRLVVGGMFIYYGWIKIENYDLYMPMMKSYIGLGGKMSYNLVIVAEFFCGILVAIGLFTRLAILPITFSLYIINFVALADQDFNARNLTLVYLMLCPVVFLLGSGRFSVDALMRWGRSSLTKK